MINTLRVIMRMKKWTLKHTWMMVSDVHCLKLGKVFIIDDISSSLFAIDERDFFRYQLLLIFLFQC